MVSYQTLSEATIIDRINDGDTALFEVLIRKYNPYLYKVGRSYGFNHHDVEDLMQETFISAYENLHNLRNKSFFKSWLIRIMLNECYRKSHKAAAQREVLTDTSSCEKPTPMFVNKGNGNTTAYVVNHELSRVIENALHNIPLAYRLVFSLRELNGMSVLETASVLNITETNVKVRLNRAKAMLRKEVQKMYTAEEIFEFDLVYCDKIVAGVMSRIKK
jgi:RNA polymerase sigma-70 factor (ECF subfamily)